MVEKIGRSVLRYPRPRLYQSKQLKKRKVKRVDPWLKEYEAEEKEATETVVEKLSDRIASSMELGIPSLTELARIPYEDKFQFKKLIAYRTHPDVPLSLLLPFNEQVIIGITAFRRKKDFIRLYGLTPEEIAYLYDKERILPILLDSPTRFRELAGDYVEVLLEKRPPTYLRTPPFLNFVSNEKLHEYLKASVRLAEDAKANIQKRLKPPPKGFNVLIGALPAIYPELCCLGFSDLVNDVLMSCEPALAAILLAGYDLFLSDPIVSGLGATLQITKELERSFGRIVPEGLPRIKVPRDLVFPVEVGQFLTDFYDLAFPVKPDMEIVDKAYRDKALIKARGLLTAFDRAVCNGDGDEAVEKGRDLKDVFMEAYEALPTLDKRVEKCRWTFNAVAYGAIGLLGMLIHPAVGLLAGMGYRVSEKKVTELVAPKLAGIRFNPLSIAIWEFKKEFKNVQELKNEVGKIRKLRATVT